MRIDAHQHFWQYSAEQYEWIDDSMAKLRRDFLPSDLERELRAAGFDGSIAVQAQQSIAETEWLLGLADKNPFVIGVVGWVDLRSPQVGEQLSRLSRNPKFLGVRHIVQSEPDDRFLLGPEFLRGIAALAEFDLSYDILIYPRHLPVASELVRRFPQQRFVLDHLAKPFIKKELIHPWASDLKELAKHPNVYCKLSGLVTEADWQAWKPGNIAPYVDVALECFGPERLMIGSDWPVCTVAASYSQALRLIPELLSSYPDTVFEAVLGETARKFWKLG